MTSAGIPAPVHGRDAGGPNPAQGTDTPKADPDADHIQGVGGGPKVQDGEGPIPGTEAAVVGRGIEEKRRRQKSDRRHPQRATAVLGGPAVLTEDTIEAVVLPARLEKKSPDLHLPDDIKKKRRRTRIVKKNGTGGKTESGAEVRESALAAKRREVKIRSEMESASLTVRKET